jgi:hypothetical protein
VTIRALIWAEVGIGLSFIESILTETGCLEFFHDTMIPEIEEHQEM